MMPVTYAGNTDDLPLEHPRLTFVRGDGRNVGEWMYVDGHCCAIQLVLSRGQAGEIYNVGARMRSAIGR
ncbi:hypothetical protein [Salinispora vitiensis]|uniref:hypothetical protein n=1 Tax=Salinispora vitiensis TaxID=999544 RepID=UPI000374DFD5|nr:hypothetical protein [Salinispora vitiensis]